MIAQLTASEAITQPIDRHEQGALYELPRHVESLDDCYFYHTMELPEFGLVPGHWDLRDMFDDYVGHVHVRNRRVLDIGAASGFLTFEAERRGANVVSFDIGHGGQQKLLPFHQKLYYRDHARWAEERSDHFDTWKNAYWLSHRLFKSQARVHYGDIHQLPPALGRFDVVIVGAVLEHVNDQISALASISRVTGETMVIATDLIDSEERTARFEPRANNPDQDYTWWTYSLGTYREVLGMLGFEIERVTTANYRYARMNTTAKRYSIVARRVAG